EHEEIGEHQQQRIEQRPEGAGEGAAVAAEDVAAHHGSDQAAIAPYRMHRVDERAAKATDHIRALQRAFGHHARPLDPRAAVFHHGIYGEERPAAVVKPGYVFLHRRDEHAVLAVLLREFDRQCQARALTGRDVDGHAGTIDEEHAICRVENVITDAETIG